MPVARATLKQCLCKECIEKGGYDEKGAPKGVLMAERSIVSHVLHVKMERATDNTSSVAIIADDLRRLTLAMDMPVNISSSSTVCTVELKPDAVLDNIESRIQQCFHLLLHSCRIDHVGHELHLLRKAMQKVTRQTNIIIAQKKAIRSQIDGTDVHNILYDTDGPGGKLFPMEAGGPMQGIYRVDEWADVHEYSVDGWAGVVGYYADGCIKVDVYEIDG
ncbi:uncharacterized protein HD556DRAFT_1308291 [Suillus plorans]|uniref:Uncharacterized protein n=1 Tax=Suillus plorans TaxID=116603 RepID=A0A9P7AQT1_9AGAM|nr:uncharacterized protein HD556DRAFT_1308291 [Suillus plorans]KAG1794242.1 hypothetical protein HD556DRAFT_1308291 [Suillus plorans]